MGAAIGGSGPFSGAAGSLLAPWTKIVIADAIDDPGTFTTTGTGYDGDMYQIAQAGDITLVQGWQANWPGWSVPLLDWVPGFNPDTESLDLGLEIGAMPLSTAKYGWWLGIVDGPIATRASIASAAGIIVFPNSAVNTNGGLMGATVAGSSNTLATSGGVTAVRARLRWLDVASPTCRVTAECSRSVGGDADVPGVAAIGAAFSSDPANWRIAWGSVHYAAVTGTPVLRAAPYVRRVKDSGRPFP